MSEPLFIVSPADAISRRLRPCRPTDSLSLGLPVDGGMYVPSLVEQIHNGKTGSINLKGFAVGNGIIGHADTFPGMNSIHYEMLHSASFQI